MPPSSKRKNAEPFEGGRSSKLLKQQIADDDAAIRELEKKLGIKKNRKSTPKSFKDDGLEDLFGADFDKSDDEDVEQSKQKAEYDSWLASKRASASEGKSKAWAPTRRQETMKEDESSRENEEMASFEGFEDDSASNGEDGEDGFEFDSEDSEKEGDVQAGYEEKDEDDMGSNLDSEDLDSENLDSESFDDDSADEEDEEGEASTPRVRENPYTAPTEGRIVEKYVPPSLRKAALGSSETASRLQRQLQGYFNRLSESNMLGILKDVEKIYTNHARGDANNAMIDALMMQVCNPATLPDTFYVLTAGFAAAVYKIIGESFGSQLVTKVTELFQKEYDVARKTEGQPSKHTSNLLTFMSELYVFQVVGCNMIFDFIRLLLEDITELSTELILRIVRMAGKYMRKDDPQALKDIVSALGNPGSIQENKEISVRTKFMIETITDLKNNKLKAGVQESAVVADHVARMRRLLGSLNQRRLAASGPLRVGLQDIALADTKGKWWLTGASFADPRKAKPASESGPDAAAEKGPHQSVLDDGYASTDSEDYEFWLPENKLRQLAIEQGLKKEVQQTIMIAIAGSASVDDAVVHFRKLNLNKIHRCDVALVLMTCASSEQPYNPFYAAVAKRLASDGRIRYAYRSQLLSVFRRLGESLFDEEEEEEDEDGLRLDEERLANIGKFVSSLVVDGSMSLQSLKALDFPTMQKKSSLLVGRILKSMFAEAIKAGKVKDSKGNRQGPEETLRRVLKDTEGTALAASLQFMFSKLLKSGKLSKDETKACKAARTILEQQNM
ncbi:Suppressor of glycerol defect protein 1 [Ceratocystis lukuohia]|uniref:Suppressor of glycerol defect protein 1 n=1 Tax=Ceratocystis lukuohia TaxID=2019550 RepID=A0ABR4MLJ3_9PEZI